MADIRSSQNIAQVEWQLPSNIKTFQTIAQVEYDESVPEPTGKINGIPIANISKINGIPIANISKINGI